MNSKYEEYCKSVLQDVNQLKNYYPFVTVINPPTIEPSIISLKVVAVNKEIIDKTRACARDFTREYSKLLHIDIPADYKKTGCKVYGGKWIDMDSLDIQYRHYNDKLDDGRYLLCIGVPNSFRNCDNVILENVITAERLLTAYELYELGETEKLELFSFSHGKKGIEEYEQEKKRRRMHKIRK